MTAQSRATLKAKFETGDTPTGTDYADLIDSSVSLVDASAQTVASNLVIPEAIISRVSASDGYFAGTVSAASAVIDAATVSALTVVGSVTVSGAVSANAVYAESINASALTVDTIAAQAVQASTLGVATVSAGALIVVNSVRLNSATTAAASVGGGESLPASVAGYIEINLSGTEYAVPYYKIK